MTCAALGGEVEIPTIDGGRTKVKIPAGSQSGRRMRLRGKGMSMLRASTRGDMYVELTVETPSSLNARQKELLEEFRKEGGDEHCSPAALEKPKGSGKIWWIRDLYRLKSLISFKHLISKNENTVSTDEKRSALRVALLGAAMAAVISIIVFSILDSTLFTSNINDWPMRRFRHRVICMVLLDKAA